MRKRCLVQMGGRVPPLRLGVYWVGVFLLFYWSWTIFVMGVGQCGGIRYLCQS